MIEVTTTDSLGNTYTSKESPAGSRGCGGCVAEDNENLCEQINRGKNDSRGACSNYDIIWVRKHGSLNDSTDFVEQESFETRLKEMIRGNYCVTGRNIKYIEIKEQLIDGTPTKIQVTYEHS